MARSKKEIDKELMYKKLMPTAQINAQGEEISNAPSVPLPITEQVYAAVNTPEAVAPQAPVAQPLAQPIAITAEPEQAPSDAAAIVSGVAPSLPQGELVNVMELLVEQRIDAAMEKFRCCNCEKCRKDVAAITLNKLAPCYIISTDDAKRIENEAKHAGQVATAIVQAILTVKARPTH